MAAAFPVLDRFVQLWYGRARHDRQQTLGISTVYGRDCVVIRYTGGDS
jgi:hypothetical protein